ncbi:MAG: DUF805 domain-containing protein [Hyphomonadaceae bacterium]
MSTCSACKADLVEGARFCGACGAPAPQAEPPPPPPPPPQMDIASLYTIDEATTRQSSPSSGKRLEPGETFAKRYEITSLIGEGGMGVVYKAKDTLTQTDVALKLIRADRLGGADAVGRLIREGVTSRDIRHANVVAVYDVGESDGQPYMSMEFLSGRSLRAWNRERMQGPEASLKTVANVIREILNGLEAAHQAGVVHRDLKPENVMLISEPADSGVRLKILDFGIARAPNSGDTGSTSLGTRGYMAPEQLTAPDAAQASADLYSLSVMFYEMLVGVVPQNYWQPPSGGRGDVPEAIDKLIQRGLSPSPRARPQSVAEYREALEAALSSADEPKAGTGGTWADRPEVRDALQKTSEFLSKGGLLGAASERGKQRSGAGDENNAGEKTLWQWFMYDMKHRYVDGNGRAHRKEYWGFNLGAFVMFFIGGVIDGASAGDFGEPTFIASTIMWLGLLAPSVAVASRRMHDLGYSGWMALLVAIPLVGWVVAILMGLPKGAPGANQYGPDPLVGGNAR